MTWQEFSLDSVQAVLFTADHSAFSPSRTVGAILRQFGSRFDGEMEVLPVPPGVPPEIPRIVLQSSDRRQRLSAGPVRLDCAWSRDGGALPDTSEVVQQCAEVLAFYAKETPIRAGRLGLIVTRSCPDATPAQTLIRRFCTPESQHEPFNRSAAFEIHNHKEYRPAQEGIDYTINSWVRCQCGVVEPETTPAILVTQDLNTMASELNDRRFTPDQILAYFATAAEEAESILQKYFPTKG